MKLLFVFGCFHFFYGSDFVWVRFNAVWCVQHTKEITLLCLDDTLLFIPKNIVIVACVLRNICLCNEDSFLDFMDDQDDEVNGYESILTPNTPAVQNRSEITDYLTQ